jgi:hypothetical protein
MDRAARTALAVDLELGALAALIDGKLDQAYTLTTQSQHLDLHVLCRMKVEPLLVSYFRTYGTEAPLFAHFNSGFYNYVQDSLRLTDLSGSDDYFVALNTIALLYRLDKNRQALYLELLGDLLSKHPDRFNANYLAGLAYLRAGMILGGTAQEVYDRKAIFALEAPRQAENRFNQYRFTQLKKALEADVDSAAMWQSARDAEEAQSIQAGKIPWEVFGGVVSIHLSTVAYHETDRGQLSAILTKSRAQLAAREGEERRYAGDVDLKKEVKKDSRFNAFALLLILTIVGAVVFIWSKMRKATREAQ